MAFEKRKRAKVRNASCVAVAGLGNDSKRDRRVTRTPEEKKKTSIFTEVPRTRKPCRFLRVARSQGKGDVPESRWSWRELEIVRSEVFEVELFGALRN